MGKTQNYKNKGEIIKRINRPSINFRKLTFLLLVSVSIIWLFYFWINDEIKTLPASFIRPTLTFMPTNSPTPTFTLTSTNTPVPTIDPDPIIDCKSNYCNGGMIKRSECLNSTCCQINEIWIFYKDKNQCIKDQYAISKRTVPTPIPKPTYKSNTVSCSIYYAVTNSTQTYQLSKEDCEYYRNNALQLNNQYYNSIDSNSGIDYSYQGANYYDSDALLQDVKNLDDALARCEKEFEEKKQGIMSLYGSQTGTADFIIKQLEQEYSICL